MSRGRGGDRTYTYKAFDDLVGVSGGGLRGGFGICQGVKSVSRELGERVPGLRASGLTGV